MQHEVIPAVAGDAPPMMVKIHVVEPAEQDAAIDVGSAAVGCPLVDVVRLAVWGRTVAAVPRASTIAQGEPEALGGSEQAMLTADVERIACTVDRDVHVPGRALVLLGDPTGNGVQPVLCVRDWRRQPSGLHHLHETNPGLLRAEHGGRLGEHTGTKDVEHKVIGQLVIGARVVGQCGRALSLGLVDKPRTPASGSQGGVDHGGEEQRPLVVEVDPRVHDAFRVTPDPQGTLLEPGQEPRLRAGRIQQVTHGARRGTQLFDRALGRLLT